MLSKYLKGKVLVFIDAANLESSVKSLGWWIDYIKFKDLFQPEQLVEIRDYCVRHNTENQDNFFVFLKKQGFSLITKPMKVIQIEDVEKGDVRKANFDVEIAVDAIDMAEKFETLVLLSGDSDFDYLIRKLKMRGKKVIVISTKNHVSKELVMSSDRYVDLRKLKNYIKRDK